MRGHHGLAIRISTRANNNSTRVLLSENSTWYRDKELDSVSVSVEGELGLGHPAVRDEAPWCDPLLLVGVDAHLEHYVFNLNLNTT